MDHQQSPRRTFLKRHNPVTQVNMYDAMVHLLVLLSWPPTSAENAINPDGTCWVTVGLFLTVKAGWAGVFNLWDSIKLCTYDLCAFCALCTNQANNKQNKTKKTTKKTDLMIEEEWRNSLSKGSRIAGERSLIYAEVMRLILLASYHRLSSNESQG